MANIVCNTRVLGTRLTGVQRYVQEILNHVSKEVDVVAPAKSRNGAIGHLWEQGVLPFEVGGRLLWSPSNTGPLSIRRQVVTVHDMVPFDLSETLNRRFAAWYTMLLPRLLRRVCGIITVSHFTRERMLFRFPDLEHKTIVVHNGVDVRFKPQDDAAITAAVAALGVPSRRYVLSVGSLEPRKNLKRLLAAWSLVQARIPDDYWLVLAGGRGAERVFASADEGQLPPRVHMTGQVPDGQLPALMSGATAFLYASYYEGFGLPPLEAMACGTPALTGNLTCMPEIMGDAALQVDPLDVEAIAEGILALIEKPELRAELAERGLRRAQDFTWKKAAERTLVALETFRSTV